MSRWIAFLRAINVGGHTVEMVRLRALNVAFLVELLNEEALAALRTDIDDFHVHGREVYWLCRTKQSESTFSNARFERALRVSTTFRSLRTVTWLAAKRPG